MVRVVFLGTGGAGGPPDRAHNCILVELDNGVNIVLDMGEGCSKRFMEIGYNLCDVDYIYISHLHFDHYSGIFDTAVRSFIEGCKMPKTKILVHESLLNEALAVLPTLLPRTLKNAIRITGCKDVIVLDEAKLYLYPACHTVPTYSIVLESRLGSSIFYSADTKPCKELHGILSRKLAEKLDLVIHEATLPDGLEDVGEAEGHTTVSQALKLTSALREDSLLAVTHLSLESYKQLKELRKLPKRVVIATDNLILSI